MVAVAYTRDGAQTNARGWRGGEIIGEYGRNEGGGRCGTGNGTEETGNVYINVWKKNEKNDNKRNNNNNNNDEQQQQKNEQQRQRQQRRQPFDRFRMLFQPESYCFVLHKYGRRRVYGRRFYKTRCNYTPPALMVHYVNAHLDRHESLLKAHTSSRPRTAAPPPAPFLTFYLLLRLLSFFFSLSLPFLPRFSRV